MRENNGTTNSGHNKLVQDWDEELMEISSFPASVFIGLRFKARGRRPNNWCNAPQLEHVTEICSVSNCVVAGPMIWYSGYGVGAHWSVEESINTLIALDPTRAAELIELGILHPDEFYTDDQLGLCTYRTFPWTFSKASSPLVLESRELFVAEYPLPLPEPDWTEFERLGYDVVQFRPVQLMDLDGIERYDHSMASAGYGCSPLSCNYLASSFPVNRYCLIDTIDVAFQIAQTFGREEPEPGPFAIVEVLRRRV